MTRPDSSHEYPPGEWTADGIAESLRESSDEFPLPRYEDEAVWESFRTDDLTGPVVSDLLERARAERGEEVPPLSASGYLDYDRTGNRSRYESVDRTRTRRLARFAVAECFERSGEFLDPILDYAWATCERTTWVLPAHLSGDQYHDGLPGVVPDEERTVALRSAGLARQLAEMDYVLGDRLHPALRERIRHEVDRRVLTPFEARDDLGWMIPPVANWSAVCNAGVVVAALYLLDDPDRQGRIVAKAAHLLEDYLADFDADGCTPEGINYWNYGVGHYATLAATLERRTDGAYSLLSPPILRDIAEYPLKVELSPGRYVTFSDTDVDAHLDPLTGCWLGRRLDLPALAARGRRSFESAGAGFRFGDLVRTLSEVRRVPPESEATPPARRDFFAGCDWWLSRVDPADPDAVAVAAKGGHNDEPHNHNDLGSVIFHAAGESLLTDLGRPEYDADFFGTDVRYEYLVARSLGHNVPYVNGVEQAPGEQYRAEVLERTDGADRDSLSLDLTAAYPEEAGLADLRRSVTLERSSSSLRVADEASFGTPDNEFVEVFVSYAPIEDTDAGIRVRGEEVTATLTGSPAPDDVSVERLEAAVKGEDVWRARLSYAVDDELAVDLSVDVE